MEGRGGSCGDKNRGGQEMRRKEGGREGRVQDERSKVFSSPDVKASFIKMD